MDNCGKAGWANRIYGTNHKRYDEKNSCKDLKVTKVDKEEPGRSQKPFDRFKECNGKNYPSPTLLQDMTRG